MKKLKHISGKKYKHYNDYVFKKTVEERANGVLEFLKIPYRIDKILVSEITNIGQKIHRLDFAGEVRKDGETICIILECQKNLPTEDDILRFFQYVSSLRVLKRKKVELYILCLKPAPYESKEFEINDECIYTMHIISLKDIKAQEIFKNIENKIKYNLEITDGEIAALQLIAYTDYSESTLEIIKKAHNFVEEMKLDITDKFAVMYILDVLSANMLECKEKKRIY